MGAYLKKIAIFFWYGIASLIILAAVIGVTLQALTPVINHHKYYIEQKASSILHMNVQIDEIRATWNRLGPEVHLIGLSLNDVTTGEAVIKIKDFSMQLGVFRTLWNRSPYFSVLSLSGTRIHVREVSPNEYIVNHIFSVGLSGESSVAWPDILAWLSQQNTFRFNRINIEWERLNGTFFSADLKQADVYQSSSGSNAGRVTFFIDSHISAQKEVDNQVIKSAKMDTMLFFWIDHKDQQLTSVEMECLSDNIVLENRQTYVYPSFKGKFLYQPKDQNWVIQGKDVSLTKENRQSDNYSFEFWRFPTHYAAHLNSINLSDVAVFSDFLNVFPGFSWIKEANLEGKIRDISLNVPHDLSAIQDYHFSAVFDGLGSSAYGELPTIHGLSGVVSGSVNRGEFVLFDRNDDVFFPNYFNQPLVVDTLRAKGAWEFSSEKLSLLFDAMYVKTPVLLAQGALEIDIPSDEKLSPILSLVGEYHLTDSATITQFLPMKEFDSQFSMWLTGAIKNGAGADGKILIRGPIHDFPYAHGQGVFIVDANIKPTTVSFSSEWPLLKKVAGHLLFHNQEFKLSVKADSLDIPISIVDVTIADYQADNVMLNIDLSTESEVSEYLRYIDKSPLKTTVGQWFEPMVLSGKGLLSLHLGLPLSALDADHIQVSGIWQAVDNQFAWRGIAYPLEKVCGSFHFTQNSLFSNDIHALIFGKAVDIVVGSTSSNNTLTAIDVKAKSMLSIPQLEKILDRNDLSTYLSGETHYQLNIHIPMSSSEYSIVFNTSLAGMAIKLPAPIGKPLMSHRPLSIQTTINSSADAINIVVQYAKELSAVIKLQNYLKGDPTKRDMQIDASVPTFSWPLIGELPKTENASPSAWSALSSISLRFNHLLLYDYSFSDLSIQGKKNPTGYLWDIQSNEAKGSLDLPTSSKSPIHVNFDYVTLTSPKKSTANNTTLASEKAAAWPEFFLTIQHFTLGYKKIGCFVLHTHPIQNGLIFDTIDMSNDLYHLQLHGQWSQIGHADMTNIEGHFETKNAGQFLKDMDITQDLRAKAGEGHFNLSWSGSPMNFQLEKIAGDAAFEAKDGVIPVSGDAAKMGLGKILSLFSTQSIQRRLQLNFSDLSQNGYSFNTFLTQLHFEQGNAIVNKGQFNGPEAKIDFNGQVGLALKNYHLNLVVTPYVTSTLPLIATLTGGPIVGAATYAIDKLAANSIAKLTSYHYQLVGPWSQPKLIDIDAQIKQKQHEKQTRLDAISAAPAEDIR